jgi:PAS domain S-box-containing protein
MAVNYRLQELIDIPKLQSLLDSLYASSGIPSSIIDLEGNILTGSGWQDICTKFHRVHPETLKDCLHSDVTIIGGATSEQTQTQITCPRGLTDTATPLIIEGRHLANVFTGQLFIEKPDREVFRQQARHFGFDEAAYLDAFDRIPVITQTQLDEYLVFITQVTEQLAILGLTRVRTLKAKEGLQASEARLQTILETALDGFWIVDMDGRLLAANEAYCAMSGYTQEELVQMHISQLEALEASEDVMAHIQAVAAGRMNRFETIHRRKDGSLLNVEISVRSIPKTDQQFAFIRDVTERKQVEEALQKSEKNLRKAQQVAHVGSWIWDIKADRLEWSDEMYHIFGIEKDRFHGVLSEVIAQAIHPDDRAAVDQSNLSVAQQGIPIPLEYRVIWPDGTVRVVWAEAGEITLDEAGKPAVLSGIVQDITDRRQVEERLAKLSNRAPGVIYEYRLYPDGRSSFPYSSAGMEEIYEVTSEEVREDATPVFGRIHPDDLDSTAAAIFESARTQKPFHWDFRVVLPRQGMRWRTCDATPELLPDGSTLWYGIIIDSSDRKLVEEEKQKLQAQLQQSQKMESLGSLAGGVAHDMNNVLSAILGMATANIKAQPAESPGQRAYDTIIQAATRGGKMVKSLLGFARLSPVESLELDINEVLRDNARLLERTTMAKVRLELDLADDLRPIRGDASALTHAFMNLCVNAVDAMPDNGTLTLHTRNVDNAWIEVVVEDTGTGMPKEVLEKALDPFFTTKEVGKGTGLGLSMVYRTVQAHHGQMEIQSVPGQGTRVMVRFPACEPVPMVLAPVAEPEADSSHVAWSVLAVDDDELIQCTLQALLEILGHSVTIAPCGEEALAKLEAGLQPDVVILDMNMPGLGGEGTLPCIRALNPTVPVLLATGRVDEFASDLAAAHPFVTLLPKPYSMEELKQGLEAAWRGRGPLSPRR